MLPSTAITRFDLSIASSAFNLLMNQKKFVGHRVYPMLGVALFAADFLKINIASLLTKVEDTERNPKSSYKRDDFTWDKDSYATVENGAEEITDDELIARYGSIIRAETIANMRAVNRVLQSYENAVATAAQSTANLPDGAGSVWSTVATGTPITDIDTAMNTVEDACGRRPNCLVLTRKDLMYAIRCDQVTDRIKYDGHSDMKDLENNAANILAQICGLEEVIVAQAKKNTADKGQTASLSNLWTAGKATVFCRGNDGMNGDLESIEPQLGRTLQFLPDGGEAMVDGDGLAMITEEYREENRRGGVIRSRTRYQVKDLHTTAAYVLTGLSA